MKYKVVLLLSLVFVFQTFVRAEKRAYSRFDVRMINPHYNTLDHTKYLEDQVGVINIVTGNSFSIDLDKGVIKIGADSFEKAIKGETYGSDFRIEPQEVVMHLNCCYST